MGGRVLFLYWLICGGVALFHAQAGSFVARTNSFSFGTLSSEYSIRSLTVEEGLPQNTINCLLQTSDGYLWIGTREGLVRYDGRRPTLFDRSNTPAFRNHDILALAEHPAGCLWIGTSDGLVRYSGHQFTGFRLVTHSNMVDVRSICARRQGGVWLGTSLMPMQFEGERATLYTNYPGYDSVEFPAEIGKQFRGVNSVLEDASGTLWVGDIRGLVRLRPGASAFEVVHEKDGYGYYPFGVGRLASDPSGGIWFGNKTGLFRYRADQMEFFPSEPNGLQGLLDPIGWDRQGGLWIHSDDGGLSRWHDGRFTHYRAPTGLPDDAIACVCPDREGNLWVGTASGGLSRLQPRRLINYTTTHGLAHNDVWTIAPAPDGSVWIGTQNGLNHFQNGKLALHQVIPTGTRPHHHNRFRTVWVDRKGQAWSGTTEDLWRFAKGNFVSSRPPRVPGSIQVEVLYEDRSGALWVGTASPKTCTTAWAPT